MTPIFDPADFEMPPGLAHVCAGGETPLLRRHAQAYARYARDKAAGMPGRTAQEAVVQRVRERMAALWRVQAGDIGFVSSVAEGVSLLVDSLEWRDGDNIVLDVTEYPSVAAPFALKRGGPALRLAEGQAPDRLASLVDDRTRVIAVSAVSYLNGERFDLAALRKLADSVGAMLVVDCTQGAGYLRLDASVADFAFAASYKWLLGVTGVATAYWNRARQPGWTPGSAGWHSLSGMARPDYAGGLVLRPDALCFTRGNPAHLPLYILDGALDYLAQHDAAALEAHVLGLTAALRDGFSAAGIASTTPAEPARQAASVTVDTAGSEALVAALEARGVMAWGGR
ncbi:aminotransferase class V-fold PLP-dependent enzyme, partial [Roseomonas sp. 18066]|uniref:aminotransferase class V-fold PLP-dependent enzyme n=1 Tax=Roseomonas sp. 18066 TaxID=2681412 RepID=UPI00135A988D